MPRIAKIGGRKVTWKPIESVPRETSVTLKTVKGIICQGVVAKRAKFKKPDRHFETGKRIPAKRTDLTDPPSPMGDVVAVGWR